MIKLGDSAMSTLLITQGYMYIYYQTPLLRCAQTTIHCVTVTRGVSSAGLDGGGGGAQYRLVFIRARAPAVAVYLVIA